jgi:hypothetical protein
MFYIEKKVILQNLSTILLFLDSQLFNAANNNEQNIFCGLMMALLKVSLIGVQDQKSHKRAPIT